MSGTMRIINSSGDTKLTWKTKSKAEVEAVRQAFGQFHDQGYSAYAFKEIGKPGELATEFDPTAQLIIMAPRMAGG
jgi:hypothetical protein